MLEGRTTQQKHELIRLVTDAVARSLDANPESVRVIIREMHADHFGIGGEAASQKKG
jgi:4-oxalocrotonate tautomerase